MSIDNKIKRYKKYYVGLAYLRGAYEINTYIVINKENIEFILDKYYDFNRVEQIDEMVKILEEKGYKCIDYYLSDNIKKLVKENNSGK